MRLLPRSLAGRQALLIVALVGVGQFLALTAMRELVLKPRFDQLAEVIAQEAVALRAGLAALPPDERAGFVAAFDRDATSASPVAADAQGPIRRLRATALERRFLRDLARRLDAAGSDIAVSAESDGSVSLLVALDDTTHRIVFRHVLKGREVGGAWILATVASAALGLVGALLIQRRMNLPIERLVDASRRLASGGAPGRLPESGPVEAMVLSRSFNQLVDGLAEADRERALMLAGVSHDLRTPLAKLRLGVEILGDRHEPHLVAQMRRSIADVDAIVGQFLDFARAGTDEPVIAGDLDALAGELAAAFAEDGRVLELECGAPPRVPMRALAVRRGVANLLENAWRHGRPPVTLRTGVEPGGHAAWIEVTDCGLGLADPAAMKLPFRRGRTAGGSGAGLGLAIAERVARDHAGRLDLVPNLPSGLRARLVLPAEG